MKGKVEGSSPLVPTIQFVLEPDSLRERVRVRFLFIGSSAEGLHSALNEQRQGIIMAMVSCLLLCGIKFALCELGRPPILAYWGQSLRTCVPGACTPLTRCNTLDFVPKSVCQGAKPLRIPAERVRTYAEKWQNFTISGCSFIGEYGILGLVQQIRI